MSGSTPSFLAGSGLPRAEREWRDLSESERATRPALVPPELVAQCVVDLAVREDRAGWVVELLDGSSCELIEPGPY